MKRSLLALAPLAAAPLLLAAPSASGNELILTKAAARDAMVIGLDLSVTEPAVGFEVRIEVPAAAVDTSGCMSKIPGLQIASCVFNGREVVVLALTEGLRPLSPGLLDLGEIRIRGLKGEAKVGQFVVSDAKGEPLSARVSEAGAAATPGHEALR
ncbi:MAG: hypothetical protein RML12_04825 [Xanthomonadales bacterium]|nr:hypothetical protein [Xanthomonadales bacterium]